VREIEEYLDPAVALRNRPRPLKLLSPRLLGTKAMEYTGHIKPFTVSARTFFGSQLSVVFPDRVSMEIYRYGFFDENLTRAFLQILKPGMTFFDVGAHVGYFSTLASLLVGAGGSVHAFEPTPSTFRVLVENLEGTGIPVNLAVHQFRGEVELRDLGWRGATFNSVLATSGGRAVRVRTTTLDAYSAETGVTPDVVKIDVEGLEEAVLLGARNLLTHARPLVALEVNINPERHARCLALMAAHEYRCVSPPSERDNLVFVPG
jgi:FkbM family methyltransferase